MHRLLLLLFLVTPFFSGAQKLSGYINAEGRYEDSIGMGYGAGAGIRYGVARVLQLGLQASGIKFEEMEENYYPVVLTARVKLPVRIKIKPFLQAEGGLGIYNHTHENLTAEKYSEAGKFTFGGSVGFIGKGKLLRPSFSFGYYQANIEKKEIRNALGETVNKKTNFSYDGFFLRIAIEFP